MHLLYFFPRGCPRVLQEKFEALPSANGAAMPIFPIFAVFSIYRLYRQNSTMHLLYFFPRGWKWILHKISFTILALKMAEISDFLVFSDTAKEQHQWPLKRFNTL